MSETEPEIDESVIDAWNEEQEGLGHVAGANEDPASKYAQSQLRVVRETRDYQLDYIQHALQPGRELINIAPSYQRRLRWDIRKRSLLIESFLLNIPVPPIFLFEEDYNTFEVIDGRQRLDTIRSFLANDFALRGLEYWPELNDLRFNELPKVLRSGLLRRGLQAVVLLAETRDSAEEGIDVRRVLFDRLNTGGEKLNPQELRNALYPGRLNQTLISLARSDLFTEVWGIPKFTESELEEPPAELTSNPLYSKLADAELILRVFALKDAIDHDRRGSLRTILDRYMAENSDISEAQQVSMKRRFLASLQWVMDAFGESAFRLPTSRLSRPLYDALMIAHMQLAEMRAPLASHVTVQRKLAAALRDDSQYEVLVGRGNTIGSVKERVGLARTVLAEGE
ncbi:DUF262 domain-containing protein [Kocuria carniphila]|uniref:DUF262 domain-containing protein n=1 Tax=Kocuria carniphila TaxID=262208 RepID=UPI0021A95AD6|nr:DUF262 domain-containing protein [Kocuria carniphila]MCT1804022.1 DUF262 domain-containing protein [Kocuria carniphila]